MDEVVIVHVLSVEKVAVLPLAQVFGVDAIGPEELLVGDTERLTNRLSNQLSLQERHRETVNDSTTDLSENGIQILCACTTQDLLRSLITIFL